MPLEIKAPKNIQEGTANHVRMALNELENGNVKGAEYLLIDLLDELIGHALVVTAWVPPLDHTSIEALKRDEYKRGLAEGRKLGRLDARKDLAAKIAAVL